MEVGVAAAELSPHLIGIFTFFLHHIFFDDILCSSRFEEKTSEKKQK